MVPSARGSASAWYTRRCCSTSERPPSDGAVTTTWKWSPPPVRSITSSSVASGNADSSKARSGSVAIYSDASDEDCRGYNAARRADVAELVDAHGSGPCARKGVEVQVLSSAL